MKGCITADSAGNYFLVPRQGKKVQLNTSGEITSHVGQQVKVSGAFVDAQGAAGSSASGGNPKGKPKERPARELRVVKVDVLAATCPTTAAAKKK